MFAGEFTVLDVKPQEGEQNAKVKVKVRVNIHGIFAVSSAARVEKHEKEVEAPRRRRRQTTRRRRSPWMLMREPATVKPNRTELSKTRQHRRRQKKQQR